MRISGRLELIGLRMGKHGQEVHEVEVGGGDEMDKQDKRDRQDRQE